MAAWDWDTEAGGSFEAWKYDPEGDAGEDKTPIEHLEELPDGYHRMLHRYERPANMHYYILRKDLEGKGRYITFDMPRYGYVFKSNSDPGELISIAKGVTVQVIGVLLTVDPDAAAYGEPTETFKYLYAMKPDYKYVVMISDDKSRDKRTITLPGSSVAGGGSAAAAGGGSAAAAPPSAKRFRGNNFNAKPEISIPNMPGGMRKLRSKNKKSQKSRKSQKSQKSQKSRKNQKSRN